MSAQRCLSVYRIDNGYLVEYVTGKAEASIFFGENHTYGTRHALNSEDTGRLVTALLDRQSRVSIKELVEEEDDA